ncbi:MAG: hypothetical protein HZB26_22665 [Candidatus Hydrogenedentes bacterium]|nr:hypothetical protein [Candidatus Hydrogenedentota bacterium]
MRITLPVLSVCLWRSALLGGLALLLGSTAWAAGSVDLSGATLVVRPGKLPNAEKAAATVLVEEVEKRTGIHLPTATKWPNGKAVIAITSAPKAQAWGKSIPARKGADLPELKADGYRLFVDSSNAAAPVVWVIGADARAALYGVGALLRNLDLAKGQARLAASLDIATAPASPIRGHQIGYRHAANSWDAWDAKQFDQYFRELALFGANSIEGIPFQDDRTSSLMKYSRREMNKLQSEMCQRYGLDYWVWTPADFDLKKTDLRTKELAKHEELYRDCPELAGVFVPGGDPGSNPPELVMPFLEDLAKRLKKTHPKAKVWLSLQGFEGDQVKYVFDYLAREHPTWLGGLCEGPSSPPIAELRKNLPKQYKLRMYPDITHNKLSQYEVPWWDQAYANTLGREAINPRPTQYQTIHNWFAPYCDGFISYSDGVHDDVNKTVWSALSWDVNTPVRDILVDYARLFFGPAVAEDAADGILALEKNWRGPLLTNGAVEGTLLTWQGLEKRAPELADNWRWQMCLVRANYDAFLRRKLVNETTLEEQANAILLDAGRRGADKAITEASAVLNRSVNEPVSPELRTHIVDLYDRLFKFIGLQSSVPKYQASGEERGASLDFIDNPLNNRWWLEDEFKKVQALGSEAEKCARLAQIAAWEHPGPGSYYDNVGNTAKSPHVLHSDMVFTVHAEGAVPGPTFWWWDEGKSRKRLSWQVSMDWPQALVYEGLDPGATYVVRTTGYGKTLLKMNGVRVEPAKDAKEIGELREFPVAPEYIKDRKLTLTFDRPTDEGQLNWRQQSRLSEVWLVKTPGK